MASAIMLASGEGCSRGPSMAFSNARRRCLFGSSSRYAQDSASSMSMTGFASEGRTGEVLMAVVSLQLLFPAPRRTFRAARRKFPARSSREFARKSLNIHAKSSPKNRQSEKTGENSLLIPCYQGILGPETGSSLTASTTT